MDILPRVLVAEDDLIAQQMIRAFLQGQGFDVIVAGSGTEAWELFQADPTRIVVTDWQMPGMSGLELCKRIREEYDGNYTYIILLTASTQNIDGLAAGADEFVVKPFEPDELRFRLKSGQRVLQLEDRLEEQISNANASREELRKTHELLRCELDAAAELQRSLLPKELPEADELKFAWSFEPSELLGGDTFNVFQLANERYGLVVADVSGHGIKASLLAVTLQHVLNPRYRHTPLMWTDSVSDPVHRVVPPTEVLARLNQQFPMNMEIGQYFTVLYAVLESDTGRLRYSSAGHPPPILIPANGIPWQLPGTGMPIGLHEDNDYIPEETRLSPGDRLLLFSDGLTETANSQGEMIGDDRVLQWLEEGRALDVDSLVNLLAQNIRAWARDGQPDDDVSLFMVEFVGQRAPITASSNVSTTP